MKLESLAALVAIVEFVGKVWMHIWERYKVPIRRNLSYCIDQIIFFLVKIKQKLNDTDDNSDSNIYGVTGGTIFSNA